MVYSVTVWCFCFSLLVTSSAQRDEKESSDRHIRKRGVQSASVAGGARLTSNLQVTPCLTSDNAKPRNCRHALQLGHSVSGIYEIDPRDGLGSFDVYCDMETDGGGWTVFQRRKDGSENFNRKWNDYVQGFGHLYGEFWLGLDKIYRLATSVDLRIDLMAFDGEKAYAQYEYFTIGDSRSSYALYFGQYSGNAGDSLGDSRTSNKAMKFSSLDKDNDLSSSHCARSSSKRGGWWYNACSYANLNAQYKFGATGSLYVTWNGFRGNACLQRVEMKLK